VIEHASDVCHICHQGHKGRPKQGNVGGLVMDDLSRFCCQNAACAAYGKRGGKNLTVCMCYGAGKHLRLLYCRLCHARFSERKGTPLFQARLPAAKVESVLAHIVEGCGVRKTGRLVGVNRETVARYAVLAGTHAQALHDELVAFSPADARSAVRRKVGLRGQERKALRP
jgi:hypothetical protein